MTSVVAWIRIIPASLTLLVGRRSASLPSANWTFCHGCPCSARTVNPSRASGDRDRNRDYLRLSGPSNPGQRGSLPACCWQVLRRDEHQDQVTLGGEVSDVLGDHSPAFGPGGRRDLRIAGAPQADLSDVDGIAAVPGAQQPGRGSYAVQATQRAAGGRARAVWRRPALLVRTATARCRRARVTASQSARSAMVVANTASRCRQARCRAAWRAERRARRCDPCAQPSARRPQPGMRPARGRRALHDVIAGTAVIYSWDARAARLRFLSRK